MPYDNLYNVKRLYAIISCLVSHHHHHHHNHYLKGPPWLGPEKNNHEYKGFQMAGKGNIGTICCK